jgi:hypothetical protein
MNQRVIHRSDAFEDDVRRLSKKQPGFPKQIAAALENIASAVTPPGDRIPGLQGAPVFKDRLPYGNKGKSGGARLIYYCAEALVIPLFVYTKAELSNMPTAAIRDSLKAAGLLEDSTSQPQV